MHKFYNKKLTSHDCTYSFPSNLFAALFISEQGQIDNTVQIRLLSFHGPILKQCASPEIKMPSSRSLNIKDQTYVMLLRTCAFIHLNKSTVLTCHLILNIYTPLIEFSYFVSLSLHGCWDFNCIYATCIMQQETSLQILHILIGRNV